MGKSTHFFGQPLFKQLTIFLHKDKVLQMSKQHGGERYVKTFDGWHHLITMLYAVIMRFDSLREITASMLAEARKLAHLGLVSMPRHSTLADANARRPEKFFEAVYRDLYSNNKGLLTSDSRPANEPKWMKNLHIMDSTTISLFSNLIFKGVGRNPKTGKKKGGIKVHKVISATEGVASDIQFTSAATHDSFMLVPENFAQGDLLAIDRAYINYDKFEQLSQRGVIYVTKMKSNLKYEVISDTMRQDPIGKMEIRTQVVVSRKRKAGNIIEHRARIITYVDQKEKKAKLIRLFNFRKCVNN